MAPGTGHPKCMVPNVWYLVPGAWNHIIHNPYESVHSIWDHALRASCMASGTLHLVHRAKFQAWASLNLIFCKTHMAREAGASVGRNCRKLNLNAEIPSPRPGVRGIGDQFAGNTEKSWSALNCTSYQALCATIQVNF